MKPFVFGVASREKLRTCHPSLVAVAERALKRTPYDFTIVHGWRGKELQNELADAGASTLRWPDSYHNHTNPQGKPQSLALDFAPWLGGWIPWNETHIFACIAGCFFAAADELNTGLVWGGDWDTDGETTDQTLLDWGHVQLVHPARSG